MANPADHYDPTADLGHAVDKMPLQPLSTPPDGRVGPLPAKVESFDPTANMSVGAQRGDLGIYPAQKQGENGLRLPAGAENFDPINLTPGPRPADAPKRKFENAGTGEG
jgi:hypothetical protein